MCTGKCSRFVAGALYPLALISIICNIILFFPDWKVTYAKEGHLTEEVKYMGGLVGGGLMVIAPALFIHVTGKQGCCANRCGMFLSILFAAVGVCGALYSFVVAMLGLINGPYCKMLLFWGTPFKNRSESYLQQPDMWSLCSEPKGVVEFNIGLFSTLLVCSSLQLILCASQMINGLMGCICGACVDKGPL
ncbi:transmembrane 4 L6 family member 4 [Ictalurus punctatus]|uniref:Transmembrane 4 L6 family member 4 n=1 Tax=Ictalurus punctatus TaxID=7998 RepID=A0A2D0QEI9_ICTPU|nr:transmembrane 4 L6 family member 4 [Ictalurus punctatus]